MLKQKGYFAFTTFGRDNLKEVASVTGSGLHYRSLEELEEALRIHYEIVKAHEERICLTFGTPLEVLYHLKHTGVAAGMQQDGDKRELHDSCDKYAWLVRDGRSVNLTENHIEISANKRQ